MNKPIFIDWDSSEWKLDTIADIVYKIKVWADNKGLKDVVLCEVENSVWADPKNQRYDVVIQYVSDEDKRIRQKLLILKGEVIDGKAFHERYHEFY